MFCGLFDFKEIDRDDIFIPDWMQECLGVSPGDLVQLYYNPLEKCKQLTLRPESAMVHQADVQEMLLKALPNISAVRS